jgi:hypothetical protein
MFTTADNPVFTRPAAEAPEAPDLLLFPAAFSVELAAALDALPPDLLPQFRIDRATPAVVQALLAWLADAPGLAAPLAAVLADAGRQVECFVAESDATLVSLRLEAVADDACRKLHHDNVARRLVCTYRGPGTEWLPRAREAALGSERLDVPPALLERVPRFVAALFSGTRLPGARPVLHRSPPITGSGEVRLLLTINDPFVIVL